jgi:energy-coupling factor transporter ATP-binding protein EcfA2/uncharacterized membrane protein
MEAFDVRDLTFFYPEQTKAALDGVSFSIRQGEFVTLCGPSGCGKTTLLRLMKTVLAPHGAKTGEIFYNGVPLDSVEVREQSSAIGFVQQSPENQIVTDKVWHELAFGLESLGLENGEIRRRVRRRWQAFFGISDWFYRDAASLSGGQKQILNLASVMVMQPELLLLDEPTSRLDPVAAADFLAAVGRINRELGTSVIIAEHRLGEVLPMAGAVHVLDSGRLIFSGAPGETGEYLRRHSPGIFLSMPEPMRIWSAVPNTLPCPITPQEGAGWLAGYAASRPLLPVPPEKTADFSGEPAAELKNIWFRYEKEAPDVLKGLNLKAYPGEILAVLGGNGAGKSTLLSVAAGAEKPLRGRIAMRGRTALLPQEPLTLFAKDTVRAELESAAGTKENFEKTVELCALGGLLDRHPADLSGGELQRAALARVLLAGADILLLDEPTKGMDAQFKRSFGKILRGIAAGGAAIIMASHDTEFCAAFAHRCALLFDGELTAEASPRKFFSANFFYTTPASRMARGILPRAVVAADIISACGGEVPKDPEHDAAAPIFSAPAEHNTGSDRPRLPVWRRAAAAASGLCAAAAFIKAISITDMTALSDGAGIAPEAQGYLAVYGVLLLSLLIFAAAVSSKSRPSPSFARVSGGKGKLPKRTAAAAIMILLFIPVTICIGVFCLGDRKYYFIALLVLLEAMLPFALVFEGRKPQARELVIISVLCALGVAGRAAFFMLPEFKPVVALVIISGAAFGGESGFLVGAMTMLASNVLFGQGPWTPWQMFAMGIIGFFAGTAFRGGRLRPSRTSLCIFGALASVVVYGGIMNLASALMWTRAANWKLLLTYYATGLPWDLVRAAATVLFLWFAAEPMLEKLDRVKTKYGLIRLDE